MIDKDLLRRLRNELPMAVTIAALGRDGPPSKLRDGRFCFLCPRCGEMLVYVNPRNNLAHCFHCNANLNNIDLLRAMGSTSPPPSKNSNICWTNTNADARNPHTSTAHPATANNRRPISSDC